MSEEEIVDYLELILDSIGLIEGRFLDIRSPDAFVHSMSGMTLLDAISMRLQVIGESVRKIQKQAPSILQHYAGIDWDKIARFRDFVSHHYDQIDHEIVYDICKIHIPKLKKTVEKIRSSFPNPDEK
jgi:uncharacterized protein with HEPN domain